MDGCICGNGAGPRTMKPFIGNILLASDDPVSIDTAAAKIMGFDPMKIDYIKKAHDRGLGNGDLRQVEILGMSRPEFDQLNFGFEVRKSLVIMGDQLLRKSTAEMGLLHRLLFHSPIFRIFIMASETYHDKIWYPLVGAKMIKQFLESEWGMVFDQFPAGRYPEYVEVKDWDQY